MFDYFFGLFNVIYRIIMLNYLLPKEVYFLSLTCGGWNCQINDLQNKPVVFSYFVDYKKRIIVLFIVKKQTRFSSSNCHCYVHYFSVHNEESFAGRL